jgi:predicted DNA-binding ribbon-helix-helix protein
MAEMIQRMLPLGRGLRNAIRLDEATWKAIDFLCETKSQTWQEWCNAVVSNKPKGDNMTAEIRAAAMDGLLYSTIFQHRGDQLEGMANHSLMKDCAMLDDEQLSDVLKTATIEGESDFVSFKVKYGQDEAGQDCVWIENQLRGFLHFSFVAQRGND